jgi:glycosyltransferase involved in cell wall biosynthesis
MSSSLPLDVAIVSGDFVKTGGMDRANYALADYLSRSGSSVELVGHRVASDLVRARGVSFTKVPKPLESYLLGEPLLDLMGRRAARTARERGGVAVVNGGNCFEGPVNWVHYVHRAYVPPKPRDGRGVLRAWHGFRHRARERSALRLAHLVVCNSKATRRVVVEELDVPAERAFVVYYGIDAALFARGNAASAIEGRERLGWPARPAVAFVGALGDRRKGFDTLFEAWSTLCRTSDWDVDLVAVGGGSELRAWRARAGAAGLSERIRLLGFRSDVAKILGACDALVAPTRYEAFGLGVAEAIAMGLPAIVSASAGVAELYPTDRRHLLLEDPESVGELVKKLRKWRESPATERLGMSALTETIRARSWDEMAREMLELMTGVT